MKAKRERIANAKLPDAPVKPTRVKPPRIKPVTPDPDPEEHTGVITIDKDCLRQSMGCLQHK